MRPKLLIPLDASSASREAALKAIRYAGRHHMDVVGHFIAPPFRYRSLVNLVKSGHFRREKYAKAMIDAAEEHFSGLEAASKSARVRFSGVFSYSNNVVDEVVLSARKFLCGMIYVDAGEVGYFRLRKQGNIARKISARCEIPVLVRHAATDDAGAPPARIAGATD